MIVEFEVNEEIRRLELSPLRRLLDVLREDLRLTAAKEGCGEGECGSCSVLVDGVLVNSCLYPAAQLRGRKVQTVEALVAADGRLHPLQRLMLETDGSQCGICTPGMIMAGLDLLNRHAAGAAEADEATVRAAIAGNLCRCTGYVKIVDAIAGALKETRSDDNEVEA